MIIELGREPSLSMKLVSSDPRTQASFEMFVAGVEADRASDSLKSTFDLALTAERDQSEAGDRYLAMKPVEHKRESAAGSRITPFQLISSTLLARSPVVLPHDTTRSSFIISSKTAPPTTHTVATSSRVQTAGRGDRSGLKPVVVKSKSAGNMASVLESPS